MGVTKTSNDFSNLVNTQRGLPNYKFPDQTFKNYKTVNVMEGKYPIDMLLKVLDPDLQVAATNSDSDANDKNATIIPLNKEIVSSIFGYFKAMYNTDSNWAETENAKSNKLENLPVTTLIDFDPNIVVEFFTGVFKDQLNITSKNCIKLYELANYLNDDLGKDHISKVIKENLSQENVVDVHLKIETPLDKKLGCLEWIKNNVKKINSNLENVNHFYESLSRENFKVIWDLFNKGGLDSIFLKKFLTGWILDNFKQLPKFTKTDISIETKSETEHEINNHDINEDYDEINNFEIFPLLTEIDLSKILKAEDLETDRLKLFHGFQKVIKSYSDFTKVYKLIVGEEEDEFDNEKMDILSSTKVMDLKEDTKSLAVLDKSTIEKYPLPRDSLRNSSFISSYEDKLKMMMETASYDKEGLEMNINDGKLRIKKIGGDFNNGIAIFPTTGIKSYTVKNINVNTSKNISKYTCSYRQVGWTEHQSKLSKTWKTPADRGEAYFDKTVTINEVGTLCFDKKYISTEVRWESANDQITTNKEGVNLSWSNGSDTITHPASKFRFNDVSKLYPVISLFERLIFEIEITNIEFE